jgi:transporter family protein
MTWWIFALVSAVAAAATAILAKIGVEHVPSNLATAIRTTVILGFALGLVGMRGEYKTLSQITSRSWLFLVLSGLATGISWLAYFRALQMAPVNKVVPIDKLSLAFTIVLAALVLGETISWKTALGTALIVAGTLLTTLG